MPKTRKSQKFLNLKLIEKFLRDYRKMPYKTKASIMAAVLVILLIPLSLIIPLSNPTTIEPLNLSPLEPTDGKCYITGCANHLCLDYQIETPYPTQCPTLPQYQCLSFSKCERQPSGRCGWTNTPEYQQCLANINNNTK